MSSCHVLYRHHCSHIILSFALFNHPYSHKVITNLKPPSLLPLPSSATSQPQHTLKMELINENIYSWTCVANLMKKQLKRQLL
ncbi:hypothetical protein O6P43_004565 [Quillaja saponaria]|uniref:Uncharacterized protein n=1 Tax=Quillaja saponaria TaxID=32244 RepID=A0AAD7Q430_QUISA|nr:hypothetical protein O6P43_004565 [Quillaja saponaria]